MTSSACAAEEATLRFAAALGAAGGWEERPRLAVALSGGPDSLALALLAQGWAAARGGDAIALILDHGVRPAARIEAGLAEAWAVAAGLAARRLALPPGQRRSSAALREARHAMLARAATEAGALHLLLGHHLSDQAETVLIRALGRSGAGGLAAMAPVRVTKAVRLIRPLLGVTPAAIRAVLRERGQPWIADPSNDRGGGLRATLRHAMADGAGEGVQVRALADAAASHAADAARRSEAVTALLAVAATLPCAGGVALDRARLAAAPLADRTAALGAVLKAVSGRALPPDARALARLAAAVAARAGAMTLGGCLIAPRGDTWQVTAETRPSTPSPVTPLPVAPRRAVIPGPVTPGPVTPGPVATVAEPAAVVYAGRLRRTLEVVPLPLSVP
ncbi:tRNA lysidine(34) synthetase TilS [Elioraea sp.]|uniref:tRNA lysidine(34) synthetase TilS n=1 Tax=Elioraea sp. TaxID=2185103 RepID=UPI0025BFAA86|nr:tRNA lysidine(34) synthetase TilS [Elioraea sp.]